jgi:hypothetical protein
MWKPFPLDAAKSHSHASSAAQPIAEAAPVAFDTASAIMPLRTDARLVAATRPDHPPVQRNGRMGVRISCVCVFVLQHALAPRLRAHRARERPRSPSRQEVEVERGEVCSVRARSRGGMATPSTPSRARSRTAAAAQSGISDPCETHSRWIVRKAHAHAWHTRSSGTCDRCRGVASCSIRL